MAEVVTSRAAPLPTDPARKAFASIFYLVLLGLCITYIVVCLRVRKLRRDPGKWCQLVVVFTLLIDTIWDLINASVRKMDSPYFIPTSSHGGCMVMFIVFWFLEIALVYSLNLVSIERIASLWWGGYKSPWFSKKVTVSLVCITLAVAFIFTFAPLLALGKLHMSFSGVHDQHVCFQSDPTYLMMAKTVIVGVALLLILTLVLIGRLIVSRHCIKQPYPLGLVLHVIIGNFVALLATGLNILHIDVGHSLFEMKVVTFMIIIVLWLLVDERVRPPMRRMCCPRCPGPEPEAENEEEEMCQV